MTWLLLGIAAYLLYRWVDDISTKETKKLAARRAKKAAKPPPPPPPELVGGKRAHVILGVEEDASMEDVRVAYQRLMKDHHPDRVARLGGDEQRRAEAKSKRLNRAYEIMRAEGAALSEPPPPPSKARRTTKQPTPKRS